MCLLTTQSTAAVSFVLSKSWFRICDSVLAKSLRRFFSELSVIVIVGSAWAWVVGAGVGDIVTVLAAVGRGGNS